LLALLASCIAASGQNPSQEPTPAAQTQPKPRSAGGDVGSGAGDIGKGAAKGTGNLAKGTAKGVGDLVTLHPVGAVENVGKGAGAAAKDVGVGTAKGTGKIVEGTGKAIAHPFKHKPKPESAPPPQ
jgi:hypothetical protein